MAGKWEEKAKVLLPNLRNAACDNAETLLAAALEEAHRAGEREGKFAGYRREEVYEAGRQSIRSRLQNPDEAVIEAMQRANYAPGPPHLFRRILAALAAVLAAESETPKETRFLTPDEQQIMNDALRRSGRVVQTLPVPPAPDQEGE